MRNLFLGLFGILVFVGCDSSPGGSGYSCNNLPPDGLGLQEQNCTGLLQAGLHTLYAISEVDGNISGVKLCDLTLPASQIPVSQETYDAQMIDIFEQYASSGFSVVSNNDFLKTDTCVSGSGTGTLQGQGSSLPTVQTHIWVTQE
ncbi:MAG: hypothetical protein KDD48_01685 [Bdellovibrionales bacterium]|nr:hypothetical protein [Bdellovibrionales bacterium]